ncbi:hypothetical protein ACOSQ2_022432 [Xanthoceras sorbifolium]
MSRKRLWAYLDGVRNCFIGPWVVLGDFNEISCSSEKRGGRAQFVKTGFVEWINRNNLVDLGFTGQKYTWVAKRNIGEDIWVRLDRALCSVDWRIKYAEGFIRHLPRVNSDHCPLLLHTRSHHIPRGGLKPFRFEAMWLKHDHFDDFVNLNWKLRGDSIENKVGRLTENLRVWNKEVFGSLFKRKSRLMARLGGIQSSLNRNPNRRFTNLETELLEEYNNILAQEEVY